MKQNVSNVLYLSFIFRLRTASWRAFRKPWTSRIDTFNVNYCIWMLPGVYSRRVANNRMFRRRMECTACLQSRYGLSFLLEKNVFLPNGENNRILFFCIRVYCSQKYITLKYVISKFYVSDHVFFRLIGAIGVPCSTQEDCSRLANTECMSTCRCVLGYGGPDCDLCKYGVSIWISILV